MCIIITHYALRITHSKMRFVMDTFKVISGGVCSAKGFKASGIHCGIRKNKTKRDLALIMSDIPAAAAAVYTTNLVKGAPIYVTKENIADGYAQAVICNSGNANTCNANGKELARQTCELLSREAGIKKEDIQLNVLKWYPAATYPPGPCPAKYFRR